MYSWSQTIKVQTYLKHSLPPSLLLPITLSVPPFFSPITFSLPPSFSISLSLSIPPSPPSLSLSLSESLSLPCTLSFPSLSAPRCPSGCWSCCLCQSVGCCIDDNCGDMQEK